MSKLFLSAYFTEVAQSFPAAMNFHCTGKTVVFIPTASLPEEVTFYVDTDRDALKQLGFIVDELDIASAGKDEIEDKLRRCDCIFVGGGNTFFLLQEMKRTGCDRLISELIGSGTVYIGSSAGSIVLAPDIHYIGLMDNIKAAPALQDLKGLGIIDFYPLPHYGEYPFAEAAAEIYKQYSDKVTLLKMNNHQAIVVKNGTIETLNAQ